MSERINDHQRPEPRVPDAVRDAGSNSLADAVRRALEYQHAKRGVRIFVDEAHALIGKQEGVALGAPGTGKSYFAKQEMAAWAGVELIEIDPMGEYAAKAIEALLAPELELAEPTPHEQAPGPPEFGDGPIGVRGPNMHHMEMHMYGPTSPKSEMLNRWIDNAAREHGPAILIPGTLSQANEDDPIVVVYPDGQRVEWPESTSYWDLTNDERKDMLEQLRPD